MTSEQTIRDQLAYAIAADLERSIANLGYPVGMGLAPNPETCQRAAYAIIDKIKPRALELLSEVSADDQ